MNTNHNVSFNQTWEMVTDNLSLVRLSQQGDREAFARLYEMYIEYIYNYIHYRVADDMLAEDITSQVFLKVWEKLATYQPGQSPFVAWVYRIARNTVIDHYRSKKVVIALDEIDPVKLSHTDESDKKLDLQAQSQKLHEALQTLTRQQQNVLILKFINGFNTTEIAQKLGKQEGAVRALQMRGLQGLSKCVTLQREKIDAL